MFHGIEGTRGFLEHQVQHPVCQGGWGWLILGDVGADADAGCFEHHCYVPDWWMWPRSLTEEVGFLGTAMVMESCLERVVWGLQWEQETGILVGVVGD